MMTCGVTFIESATAGTAAGKFCWWRKEKKCQKTSPERKGRLTRGTPTTGLTVEKVPMQK